MKSELNYIPVEFDPFAEGEFLLTVSTTESQPEILTVDFDPFAEGEFLLTAPSTESQQEIWTSVQRGTEANLAFNLPYSLLLKGNLNIELFKQSIQDVIQRHEALRINFSKDGKNLLIAPSLTIEIPVINLSNFSEQKQAQKITSIKKQIAQEPFDLEKDALFRVQIIQLNTQKYLVIFSAHHIICDGWSWWLLINDLGKIYSALKQGIKPELEVAESFSEYAISQWEINHQSQNQETEEFWQKQFSNSIPVVSFPPDLPRPKTRTFNSAREDWVFPETLISQLKSFGIKQGCSFMPTFLAGFEVFLYQITKQTELNIGVSRSGQAFAGKYNLMGYCVNLLPIRTTMDPEQSFKTYLKLRNGAILDAFDYQQMNFSSLVEKLQIPVDTSQMPLLPITITVQDIEAENFDFDDLKVECVYENRYFDSFEIDLDLIIIGQKIILQCQYNTNLFSAKNIRARLVEFEALLKTIIEKPDLPITQLTLLSDSGNQLLKKDVPLSFAQKRLWFLDQLEGTTSAYNISMPWQIKGNLNIPILEKTIKTIMERHEILRTNFVNNQDGNPIIIIHKNFDFSLPIINLENKSEIEKNQEAEELLKQESAKIFSLSNDPLIRCTIIKLDISTYILLITVHHIVFDGWSMNLLRQELGKIYSAFIQNKPSPLSKLTIQYSDFAYWQQEYQKEKAFQEQLSYWKEQLANSPPLLTFPPDYPRPTRQTFEGKSYTYRFSESLTNSLKKFSQKENVTLFMTLLSAFKVLLSRYTGEKDILIGTPIAGRNHLELEPLIGFFVNTIVLRTNLDGNPSFRELLHRVKKTVFESSEYQEIPFEKLVEELNPERNLSYNPLFQVLFNMLNLPFNPLAMDNLEIEPLPFFEESSKFDITFYVIKDKETIQITWLYNKALYKPETIERFTKHFETILEGIIDNAGEKIINLPRPQLSSQFPDPKAIIPELNYPLITEQFDDWVKNTPEQIAIIQNSNQWTYQALSESAKSIAQILLNQGLKPGEVVAIYGNKSYGLIASLLGVFFAGGAILTLDPYLPEERHKIMVIQAQVKLMLFVDSEREYLQDLELSLKKIVIDPDLGKANPIPIEIPPLPSLNPNNPAYVFFTSGTTGVPKGVLGCHKGLAHFLCWQRETFQIKPEEKSAQLTGLSFDVVLRDIFLALTSGATLCLPPKNYDLSPEFILPWLEKEKITYFHTVPTLAQSWLINVPPEITLKSLQRIFFAGEPLSDTLVNRWREAFPEAGQIINLYGPTETTLAKCSYIVPQPPIVGIQPIGFPQPQTQVLIFNQNRQLCSIGEPGEIVIRTPFRSLGYVNNPQETQNKFLVNPYTNNNEDLLYYTGDQGYYNPDGSVRILGRIDDQVKIRGIRIEPQEIATRLSEYPAMDQAIVIAKGDSTANKYLVAYFVSQENTELNHHDLRTFLKTKLPEYMIPSAFVQLEKIPLNPNGKVNRRALPEPDLSNQRKEDSFVKPRTEKEEKIAKVWQEILGINALGIKDNFFELGGHSLLAISVITKIKKELGIQLSLRQIFDNPTIFELAQSSGDLLQTAEESLPIEIKEIRKGTTEFRLYFIHVEQDPFVKPIANLLDQKYSLYSISSLGELIARELQEPDSVNISIEELAHNYIEALLKFQPTGPYYLLGVSFGGVMAYEMARQLIARGISVNNAILFDTGDVINRNKFYHKTIKFIGYFKKLFKRGPSYLIDRLGKKFFKVTNQSLKKTKNGISQDNIPLRVLSAEQTIIPAILELNYKLIQVYTPKKYCGKLTLFFANDEMFSLRKGWNDLTDGKLNIIEIPGQHMTMFEQPNVQVLIQKLETVLME